MLARNTSTGTTVSKAALGVVSSRIEPAVPPSAAVMPKRISRSRWPAYSARNPSTPPT